MSEQVKRREMTLSCCQAAFCTLHSHLKDGVLERGALAKTAAMFNVNHTTMSRFWREMKKKIADDDSIADASDILTNSSFFESRKYSRGRHKKWDRGALRAAVWEVPLSDCKTFRKLSKEVQVPKSTLHQMFKREGLFRRHVSSLRPYLTEENKLARLFHALDEVYPVAGHDGGMRFKDMYDRIDIDKKWFYLTREREIYILIAENKNGDDDDDDNDDGGRGETHPYRSVRNRSYISKVMFLCAQARPRWDTGTNHTWDGKIGIWPILGHFEPAQRRSSRRHAGAPVWKDEPINREKYRELLL